MKDFVVYWKEEVQYSVCIEAYTKEEALEKWENGDYSDSDLMVVDSYCIDTKTDMLKNIEDFIL